MWIYSGIITFPYDSRVRFKYRNYWVYGRVIKVIGNDRLISLPGLCIDFYGYNTITVPWYELTLNVEMNIRSYKLAPTPIGAH